MAKIRDISKWQPIDEVLGSSSLALTYGDQCEAIKCLLMSMIYEHLEAHEDELVEPYLCNTKELLTNLGKLSEEDEEVITKIEGMVHSMSLQVAAAIMCEVCRQLTTEFARKNFVDIIFLRGETLPMRPLKLSQPFDFDDQITVIPVIILGNQVIDILNWKYNMSIVKYFDKVIFENNNIIRFDTNWSMIRSFNNDEKYGRLHSNLVSCFASMRGITATSFRQKCREYAFVRSK